MIKLNELQLNPDYEMHWTNIYDSMYGEYDEIMWDSKKYYKGYSFINQKLSYGSFYELYMCLPDKKYIFGAISYQYYPKEYSIKNYRMILTGELSVAHIDHSFINKKFRHKGLGKIMYEYFLKINNIAASDEELFEGSYHLWAKSMKRFNFGKLFIEQTYGQPDLILYDDFDGDENYNIRRFVFINNKLLEDD